MPELFENSEDESTDETVTFVLSQKDREIIASAKSLLRRIVQTYAVTPRQLAGVNKVLDAVHQLPHVTDNISFSIHLSGPRRRFGEHEIWHWWEVRVDEEGVKITSGGYFYRQSTGGDSFTCLQWSAQPGSESDYVDDWHHHRIVDDAMPFEQEIAQIDLSEGGYSLDVMEDGESINDEADSPEKAPDVIKNVEPADAEGEQLNAPANHLMAMRIIKNKYKRYAEQVIDKIKNLPPECRQSGDDSPLKDVWEEFKDQIQNEPYVMFDAYKDTISRICEQLVTDLLAEEQQLLWLVSDGYYNASDDDDGLPPEGQLLTDVAEELYRYVCEIAGDEPLESELDEEEADEEESAEIEFVEPADEADTRLQDKANEEKGKALSIFYCNPPDECDVCHANLCERKFFVDGKKRNGIEWACMCAACFPRVGDGIGWGQGQLYARTTGGKWLLVGGFQK